jgi:hypothetical protein
MHIYGRGKKDLNENFKAHYSIFYAQNTSPFKFSFAGKELILVTEYFKF